MDYRVAFSSGFLLHAVVVMVYSLMHPELTSMQVFLATWPSLLGALLWGALVLLVFSYMEWRRRQKRMQEVLSKDSEEKEDPLDWTVS